MLYRISWPPQDLPDVADAILGRLEHAEATSRTLAALQFARPPPGCRECVLQHAVGAEDNIVHPSKRLEVEAWDLFYEYPLQLVSDLLLMKYVVVWLLNIHHARVMYMDILDIVPGSENLSLKCRCWVSIEQIDVVTGLSIQGILQNQW